MSRIAEDVSKVRNYLGPGILYGFNLITLFAFTIYAMISVSPKLTLLTLLPLPFLSLSIYYVSDKIHSHSTIIQKQLSKLTVITQEVFSGIRVVKSHGKEGMFASYFESESENFKTKSLALARVNALFFPLMILLINISTLIVLLIGGKYVLDGTVTPGNIVEFIIYVNMLTWPVTSIGWIASIIQEAEASQARINHILNIKSELPNGKETIENLQGEIIFDNVNFTYPETGIQALTDFNLHIKAGQKIAILGKTASGKSTIAELILRMYDPDTGEVRLDGKNLKEYDFHSVREKIAYVPQEVFLFSDTVLNNIAFGVETLSLEKARSYAQNVCIDEEIMKLSEGYDTMVGERGVTLSGGQKQRVSIARALVRNPKFVILDDCLSAVDVETEQNILNYLNDALKDKTAIIITHRVHSLQNFDRIIVIDQGKIVEQGTHDELINQEESFYAQMLENANEGVASWS
jgi:ATP-binding cassette subfamily B protein